MLEEISKNALEAKYFLSDISTEQKNNALALISEALRENTDYIIKQNSIDVKNAKESGMSQGLIDRLMLNETRILAMADGVTDVMNLPDPCGRVVNETIHKTGLDIKKVTVPLGVIGIIYESRPNVTADAAVLCLKSGNAVILRGGKEAIYSNIAIANVMRDALKKANFDENCIQLIENTSRESANELMTLNGCLDCLIPRGGKNLIKSVVQNATVPVIETGSGNCHIYVDEFADVQMAADIIFNAKTQRIGVCNACESLVIHSAVMEKALPIIVEKLSEKSVDVRGDERACNVCPQINHACEVDWGQEYLDYIISVKTVDSIDEAIKHINKYSTHHSEAIITENAENADAFLRKVDSAAVYVNASTRFTDGGEFGMGAEIGISTQKLHARGPMGLAELTTIKYIINGNGQIRS